MTTGILGRMTGMGRMLALFAALFLAVNPHPIHAQSDDGAHGGHSGFFCEALDTDKPMSGGEDSMPGAHGDCIHHFDPLVRAPSEQRLGHVRAVADAPHAERAQQQVLSFDPPPPRFLS